MLSRDSPVVMASSVSRTRRTSSVRWLKCRAFSAGTAPCVFRPLPPRRGLSTLPLTSDLLLTANRSHQYAGHGHAGAQQMVAPVPGGAHMAGGPMGWGAPAPAAYYPQQQAFNPMTPMNQFTDPNNTTVFVGGLSGYVTEDELRSFFQGFGEITYVKIPPGKGCGFVQFVHRHAAEMAINQMQGYPIGNSRVRLSWGRSQNNSGVGTPYRPAPPPPHYMGGPGGMGGGMPPHGGAGGPYGPGFGGNPPQGPPGGMQVS